MNPHDADNAMAGDYVMGLLDDAEQAAAERRIATDQSFAQAVSAWRERLAGLHFPGEENPPSPGPLPRIPDSTQIPPLHAPPPCPAPLRGSTLWGNIPVSPGLR